MTKKQRALEIIERLKKEYPDAGCTLDYDQAWKLLVSVRLAAQCTDARVNIVVEKLYEKFPDVDVEYCVREDLNKVAERRMAVLNPVKVTVTNYPEGKVEYFECVNNPEDPSAGTRQVPFSRELYIERDDFMENPPKKFFRLQPGGEVRLRYGIPGERKATNPEVI